MSDATQQTGGVPVTPVVEAVVSAVTELASAAQPEVVAAPSAAGAVNFEAGVVREGAQFQMQAASAAPEKPVVSLGGVAAATRVVHAAHPAPQKAASNIVVFQPYVTLSLGNEYMAGLRNELKSMVLPYNGVNENFNLYNPFRKNIPEKNLGDGLMRRMFSKIISLMLSYQDRKAVFMTGPGMTINELVNQYTQELVEQIIARFPIPEETPLLEIEPTEGSSFVLTFGTLFSVKGWSTVTTDGPNTTTTINLNLVMNAGELYDTTEPHKLIVRAFNFIRGVIQKIDTTGQFNPMLCLVMNSDAIQFADMREFIAMLFEMENGGETLSFKLTSLASVLRGNEEWLPAEAADCVFVDKTDLLFFLPIFEDEEVEDGEDDAEVPEDDEE